MGTANFGIVGMDWQQRINWDRLKKYRTERAREHMKKHRLGALLCMYDENVRYLTGTLTPGWNRLKPGLRYALLCGDGAPVPTATARPTTAGWWSRHASPHSTPSSSPLPPAPPAPDHWSQASLRLRPNWSWCSSWSRRR